jgi:HEAT repeat protein
LTAISPHAYTSIRNDVSFETLMKELADPARPLAVSKLVGLSGMSAEEASRFTNVWQELDERRRRSLIHELVDLGEDNVELNFDAAFFVALGDTDPDVRRAAVLGLGEHEGRDLIDPLTALLDNDPDAAVRAEAALALGRYVLQMEFDLLRADDAQRIEGALRRTITDPTETTEVRARALESLGARNEEWVRDLIQDAYESPERRLRISAVHAMGRSCDLAWLSAVFAELENDDAEMRYEAAAAAGAIADIEATPYLAPLLHDADPEVQQAAIAALGQVGGVGAKETLQELLAEGDDRVRDAVLAALAEVDFADEPLAFKLEG